MGEGARWRECRGGRGRDARDRRGIGIGQDHARPALPAPGASDGGEAPLRRQGGRRLRARGLRALPASRAGRVPGPLQLAESAHARRRYRRRAAPQRQWAEPRLSVRSRARGAAAGRSPPRRRRALPARVQRGPASAHRHRARARDLPEVHHPRRAGLGAGRVDPRADPESLEASSGKAGARLRDHLPRPGGRALPGHAPGRDVRAQARRNGRVRQRLHRAAPPLHRSAPLGSPPPPSRGSPPANRPFGRSPEPREATAGLPLPPTLSARPAKVRRAGARVARDQTRPLHRLPPLLRTTPTETRDAVNERDRTRSEICPIAERRGGGGAKGTPPPSARRARSTGMEPSRERFANACRVVVSTPTAYAAPQSASHPALSSPERPVPYSDDVLVSDRAFEKAEGLSEAVHDRDALLADRGIV